MQPMNRAPADKLADGTRWHKSSASNPSGDCVELAALQDGSVAIRNSRYPAGPALVYTRAEIAAFLAGVRDGEFDDFGSSLASHVPDAAANANLREHPPPLAGLLGLAPTAQPSVVLCRSNNRLRG